MADFNEHIDYGEVVKEALENKGWRFQARTVEDKTLFAIPMSAKNCPGLNVLLGVSESGDCKIRCYIAKDTPKSARLQLLEVINSLNNHYRYLTVSLDSDGDILAAYDFTIFGNDPETIDRHAGTMVLLLSDIMDKCIPPIMKVVWNFKEDDEEDDFDEE